MDGHHGRASKADDRPQFKSTEFKEFCDRYRVKHDPSSPYHHRSNGYAEAAVKSIQTIVKKLGVKDVDSEEFKRALLEYRNTPRKDGLSPSERVFGRQLRSLLPCLPRQFHFRKGFRKVLLNADRRSEMLKAEAKTRYDAHAKPLAKLDYGDIVRVQHQHTKKWDLVAQVVEIWPRLRSYLVRTECGRLYRRNRQYLRRYNEPVSEDKAGNDNKEQESTEQSKSAPVRRSGRSKKKPVRFGDA